MHSVGKKKMKGNKWAFILLHNSMAPVDAQKTLGVKPAPPSSILSVCSHYFPKCHLLLIYLINPSFIQFSLQRWFLKHLFENTSHNHISSHVAKYYNGAYPIFLLVVEGNAQFGVQTVVVRISSCSSS